MAETSAALSLFRDYVFSIDAQGRVAVPADWRTGCTTFMLIPGKEATLQLYPETTFNELIMPKLRQISATDPVALKMRRQLGKLVCTCVCDKQGRIQISPELLKFADLGKRAALIGSGDFAQIMTAERWEAEQREDAFAGEDFLDILG
ncbi:MAG: hypothetical protein IJW17_05610 [Lentisphaeria bacterium]|nr:hypothetical protein [Lentisphaeria bacterium]MBR4075764.1 hypothetical protein [Lentisphaeria bacterium]